MKSEEHNNALFGPKPTPQHPHVWLYCKNHYNHSHDMIEDLKKIIGHYSGCNPKTITRSDILTVMGSAASEALKLCYGNNPHYLFWEIQDVLRMSSYWKAAKVAVDDSGFYTVIRAYHNLIMMAPCSNITLPLRAPELIGCIQEA